MSCPNLNRSCQLARGVVRQRGVSLLEVLVAVVVLSIGLLGLAGLQMSSLRNNQSAAVRTNAVFALYSIVDAMRADPEVTRSNAFDLDVDADDPAGDDWSLKQLASWRKRIRDDLGDEASGGVNCAVIVGPPPAARCTITIRWDDSLGLGGSSAQTLTTEVRI